MTGADGDTPNSYSEDSNGQSAFPRLLWHGDGPHCLGRPRAAQTHLAAVATREINPHTYYDSERYLFEEVHPRFQREGSIDAFDFFSIVIWKANRVKSLIAEKMRSVSQKSDLNEICADLTRSISEAKDDEARIKILVSDWRFPLPMASAVLTVLYPDRFTVYDYRVAGQVGGDSKLGSKTNFESISSGYNGFRDQVSKTGIGVTLREKDRYLFGKSKMEDLIRDIARGIPKKQKKEPK